MNAMCPQRPALETERVQTYREELAVRITRAVPADGRVEPLKGLHLDRSSTPTDPLHGVSEPSYCVIAQGSKEVLLGDSLYHYGSPFHHQFRAVTAMSPLQFQKQLRLQEARRLMLGEHLDAASAGLRVGYDDASQFSREY